MAFAHNRTLKIFSHAPLIDGLPAWLVTNKQICTEALDVFARTRHFEGALNPIDPRDMVDMLPLNSLIMNADTIRNIYVPWVRQMKIGRGSVFTDAPAEVCQFLDNVGAFGRQGLMLDLLCDRSLDKRHTDSIWNAAEESALDMVGADWNGRFRKVQLYFSDITYTAKENDGFRKMSDFGEKRAQELVGGAFTTQ